MSRDIGPMSGDIGPMAGASALATGPCHSSLQNSGLGPGRGDRSGLRENGSTGVRGAPVESRELVRSVALGGAPGEGPRQMRLVVG
jgi:hypothetical protein